MWAEPTKATLKKAVPPEIGETDGGDIKERMVLAHFFVGGSDWWIVEYDEATDEAFGFARLNGDNVNSEWGYIPISELRELKVLGFLEVEYDKHWTPKPAAEVDGIKIW